MLQQTQVATVLPHYRQWLRRFPDFRSLAKALESDVLHAWQGLGYYARARNLHGTAKLIVKNLGDFPTEVKQMRKLPGLGRYTANAVATFAFDQPIPVVEANIARLFARLVNLSLRIDSVAGREVLWSLAGDLVPQKKAREFNSALMDLGALICTAHQPGCGRCPVRVFCQAKDPATLPRKKPRARTRTLTEHHALAFRRGKILLEQSADRWRGMWILPRLVDVPAAAEPIYRAEFPFTHHRITLTVHHAPRLPRSLKPRQRWFPLDSLGQIPLPSPHRRAVSHLVASAGKRDSSTSRRMPTRVGRCVP
jgi:A/G-specific adenine glycosylase